MAFSIGKSASFSFNDQGKNDEQQKKRKSLLNITQLDNSFDAMITQKKHKHKRKTKYFFFIASIYAR
ncbi:MAG: hypothetical protein ACRC9T_08255 [Vibrionaceae bacterium]